MTPAREPSPPGLPVGTIARFWLPLASTWLMMATEGPFLAAVLARLPDPKVNLAAFGVSVSFALILEAPVIMLMGAATTLVRGPDSYARFRRFTIALSAAVTGCLVALLWEPAFRWVSGTLLGLPEPVAGLTRTSLALLLPWPAAIGYRRLYQGILIRHGSTRRVGYGTAVRLVVMAVSAAVLAPSGLPGALVGAAALSAGVLAEAAAVRGMAAGSVRSLRTVPGERDPSLSYRAISAFYFPLALSTTLTLAVHPLITLALGHAKAPLESLAVFPVVRALVFLFSCLGLSYQEVGLALLREDEKGAPELRRFAVGLGVAASGGLTLLALSPAADFWFRSVSGLPEDLVRLAVAPTRVLIVVPALTVALSHLRALFMNGRVTAPITAATVAEVSGIALVLYVGVGHLELVGVQAAAIALVLGRACAAGTLLAARHASRRAPAGGLA